MAQARGRPARNSSLDDDDVYYYIRWRLKLEGETENMCVCTKERKGVTAIVLSQSCGEQAALGCAPPYFAPPECSAEGGGRKVVGFC